MTSDTSGQMSGRRFADYDPDTRSWRMWPATGLWGSIEFSETWPRTGFMCGGRAYELPTSEHRTNGSECSSSLLPTPTTQHAAVDTRDPWRRVEMGKQIELSDAVKMLPTPRASDGTKGGPNQRGSSGDLMLPSAVMDL